MKQVPVKQVLFSCAVAGAATMVTLGVTSIPVAGQGTGTIVGHVRYMGPTPVNPIIRMGADPRCNKLYAGRRPMAQTFIVGADGAFANVLVNLEGSLPAGAAPTTPVVLDQKNCQYEPRVLGARVGQTLEVRNDDPTEHNVHSLSKAGNDFNTTQPIKGMPFDVKLKAGELLHVTCDNHTWMTAYVAILENPFYSVTGTDGTFMITNVPAGKQSVRAWHEVMGMQTQMVDVQPGKTATVDFTFAPQQKAAFAPVRELTIPGHLALATIRTN
jgi:plastocyanin